MVDLLVNHLAQGGELRGVWQGRLSAVSGGDKMAAVCPFITRP